MLVNNFTYPKYIESYKTLKLIILIFNEKISLFNENFLLKKSSCKPKFFN